MKLQPCAICGGPRVGMKPHAATCPWQTGKLDVECAACGLKEAAAIMCSVCLHKHAPGEFRGHEDSRALHYHEPLAKRPALPV